MTSSRRRSGVSVRVADDYRVESAPNWVRSRIPAELMPALRQPQATARRSAGQPREEESLIEALARCEMQLIDAVVLRDGSTSGTPRARRRSIAPQGPGQVELDVPLGEDEAAAVLIEQNGVYSWQFSEPDHPSGPDDPPDSARRGAGTAGRRAHFVIALSGEAPASARAGTGPARRGIIKRILIGKVVAYVFRFVAGKVLGTAARVMERHVEEGLLRLDRGAPLRWNRVGQDLGASLPRDRPARILLFVHGTFSSTEGSFGAWAVSKDGGASLTRMVDGYDLVLGYEHRSLSVLPSDNAADLVSRLETLDCPHPPQIDLVAFSRGGLVTRCFIEQALHHSAFHCTLGRTVFVACTLSGTELASSENWRDLVDRYTNLSAFAARGLALIPGAASSAAILMASVRSVGDLVKLLATSAVDDAAVPGLSAMNPGGPFLRALDEAVQGQTGVDPARCLAVRSDFEPDVPGPGDGDGDGVEQPAPSLWLRTADRASDGLLGQSNDLVVHTASMISLGPARQITQCHDFGSNARVHHCNYFLQTETREAIERWLLGDASGSHG